MAENITSSKDDVLQSSPDSQSFDDEQGNASMDMPIPVDPLIMKGLYDAFDDQLDIESSKLKGAERSTLSFNDACHNLYKASSVPHLHSKTSKVNTLLNANSKRKKTTEANPILDPLVFTQLRRENSLLKNRLICEEEERKKICSINQAWDVQYNALKQKYDLLYEELKQMKGNLVNKDKELSQKDKKLTRLTKKLECLIVNSCDSDADKPLWKKVEEKEMGSKSIEDGGKQKDEELLDVLERTERLLAEEKEEKKNALQQLQEVKARYQFMDNALTQQTQQRIYLQNELKRLSTAIGNTEVSNHMLSTNSTGVSENQSRLSKELPISNFNDVELLKQQLQVYAEDFNAEKDEKRRLVQENDELKRKIGSLNDEKDHLQRQLQIYEDDFHREREKRINLMRRTNFPPDEYALSSRPTSASSSVLSHRGDDDQQQKWKEYCCLVVEKDQIADRIVELESQGIARYDHSRNQTFQQSRMTRGRGPSTHTNRLNFNYNGDLVRDGRQEWPTSMYMGGSRVPSESNGGNLMRSSRI